MAGFVDRMIDRFGGLFHRNGRAATESSHVSGGYGPAARGTEITGPPAGRTTTMAGAMDSIRADYAAAKQTRFRRRRTGVSAGGSGSDFHYRSEADYLRMMELARDMDRNDAVVGQIVDRAKINAIQDGITVDPMTGDGKLDADLAARWLDWTLDADACDVQGEHTLVDMQHAVLRHELIDGDIVALLTNTGAIQLVEAHRVRTPKGMEHKGVVHGVALDGLRRRTGYFVFEDEIDPRRAIPKGARSDKFATRDDDGHRQVCHIYSPKRVSQTRGITALAPIVDLLGMFEDINFAKLVQQQVVSCFAVFEQMEAGQVGTPGQTQTGDQTTDTLGTATRTLEGISPGMRIRGAPGMKLEGFSPNVPNPEYFQHVRLILTLVGVNLGMPLVLVLMDASETNFSGWRGAVDQARMGFRDNQRQIVNRFLRPIYRWKVRQWIAESATLRRASNRAKLDVFAHRWTPPNWPYIEPKKDAEADVVRLKNGLISPRRQQAERGRDWNDVSTEIVEDRAALVRKAIEEASAINREQPDAQVDWREIAAFDQKGRKPDVTGRVMENLTRGVRAGVPIAVSEARAHGLGLAPEPPDGDTLLRFNDQDVLAYHIENGVLTINEARARLKLPAVTWGDVPVRRQGVVAVDTADRGESDGGTDTSESESDKTDTADEETA